MKSNGVEDKKTEVVILAFGNDTRGVKTEDCRIADAIHNRFIDYDFSSCLFDLSYVVNNAEMEKLITTALSETKIIIMVGTKPKRFNDMYSILPESKMDKMIVPVYAGMTLSKLPAEIRKFQAQNYERVGALENLIVSIGTVLGRDDLDYDKRRKKKNIKFLFVIALMLLLLVVVLFNAIKRIQTAVKEAKTLQEKEEIYEDIKKHYEDKEFSLALDRIYAIGDYKDVSQYSKKIKGKYSGYYKSDDDIAELHLAFSGNDCVQIECKYLTENGYASFIETILMDGRVVEFSYVDSQNKNNKGTLELCDKEILLSLSDIVFAFDLNCKSDKPIIDDLSSDKLKLLVQNEVTLDELGKSGYILKYVDSVGYQSREFDCSCYNFKDTNVSGMFGEQYIILSDDGNYIKCDYQNMPSSPMLYAVQAPAKLLCPDLVGQKFAIAQDKEFFYINEYDDSPFGTWWPFVSPWEIASRATGDVSILEDNSLVVMIPRDSILGQGCALAFESYSSQILEL